MGIPDHEIEIVRARVESLKTALATATEHWRRIKGQPGREPIAAVYEVNRLSGQLSQAQEELDRYERERERRSRAHTGLQNEGPRPAVRAGRAWVDTRRRLATIFVGRQKGQAILFIRGTETAVVQVEQIVVNAGDGSPDRVELRVVTPNDWQVEKAEARFPATAPDPESASAAGSPEATS